MKILVFSPYYPPHTGGLENYAYQLNIHLSSKKINITVFTPLTDKSSLKIETVNEFLKIYRYPAFDIVSNYPVPKIWHPYFWKYLFKIWKTDYDITLSHTRFFLSSLLALLYSKTTKTRWIHIEHGSSLVSLTSRFKTFVAKCYDSTFGKTVLRSSDLNISISKAVSRFISKFDDKRKSPVIYRGLELEEIDKIGPDKNLIIQKESGRFNNIVLLFAGRLYKWKGVENSIMAAKKLESHLKKRQKFIIVGDGEDFSHLKSLAYSSGADIEMTGSLPWEKVISIMKAADIFIHSSLPGGGLATSLLEAMHCECAVVATPNEGADEVINSNTGILIKKPYIEGIAQGIKDLLKDSNKKNNLSKNARNLVAENFNWDKASASFLQAIGNLEN